MYHHIVAMWPLILIIAVGGVFILIPWDRFRWERRSVVLAFQTEALLPVLAIVVMNWAFTPATASPEAIASNLGVSHLDTTDSRPTCTQGAAAAKVGATWIKDGTSRTGWLVMDVGQGTCTYRLVSA